MKTKQKELLQQCYQYHVERKQTPWTPRDLRSLKPLLAKNLIEPIKYAENGKNYLRFQITGVGINYLMTQGMVAV